MIFQVTIVIVTMLSYACTTIDGGGYGGFDGFDGRAIRSVYGGGDGGGQNYPPKPYEFHYQARDEQGNVHYRNEQGDQSGAVKGSYGYTDAEGLYREVQYVADANGYRATIRTNEPGTDDRENPADVNIVAEDPPAGIQDRWTKVGIGAPPGASRAEVGHDVRTLTYDSPINAIKKVNAIRAGGGSKCKNGNFDVRNCVKL